MRQESIYRFEDLDDDGTQYLVKIDVVDMNTVDISQHPSGEMRITPKEVVTDDDDDDDAPATGKYRLEPEGDMYRLYATRDIRPDVLTGTRGGLVGDSRVLEETGSCWVRSDAKVGAGCRIRKDATVGNGCDISGSVIVAGHAYISYSKISGDDVTIEGSAHITDSTLSSVCEELVIRGNSIIAESTIETFEEPLMISGCNINGAHIRNQYELLSVHHNSWGWLSAYRNKSGAWQFTIGCKTRGGAEALKALAVETAKYADGLTPLHQEMLNHFLSMVEVSSRGWVGYTPPAPVEEPKSVEAPHGAALEVPVNPFQDLADRARNVSDGMLLRPAAADARQLRDALWAANRPDHDQYGTEL